MPAWWGRKSSKNKHENPHGNQSNLLNLSSKPEIESRENKKPKSLEELIVTRDSPRCIRDFAGFSGFEPDSVEKRGHPLPRPSVSSVQSDHGTGSCSGSGSVSSIGSSVSSDDQGQFGGYSGGHGDVLKLNSRPRSPCQGASSRGPTSPTSPLHLQLYGVSLDSPTGRQHDDAKSECHPLPLPPGSPASPSAIPGSRFGGAAETCPSSTIISKWKKGRLLGRGTFGHVYLGFNSEKGRMCAIKEVRVVSDDQTSKECLKQLNQEINLLSQLSHPNIVQYYGSELSEETLSVYLEYVSGGSIHKLLQEYGPFKEPVIQNYTRQILCGLAYLHGRNTVHRDIKGANILVDPNGEIKLADFGMAKHITACSSMLSFKGSPYWMAPEVVMNTNGYNLAVDIWSLGCTILEMAMAKPPWSQYEGVAAIFKIGNSKEMPEIPDYLSNDAKNFIRLCLQRDPSARPTASQLLEHPFIRDQTTRATNSNIAKNAFLYTVDGSRTPPVMERISCRPTDGYVTSPLAVSNRAVKSPSRGNQRMIASLPVSPCSSPLRQHRPAYKNSLLSPPHPSYKNCLLSPPHPSYPLSGQNGNDHLSEFAVSSRPYTVHLHDTLLEPSMFRAQTPNMSPRSRLI